MYTRNPLRAPQFYAVKNHRCFYFFIAMLCLLIFYCGDLPTDPQNSTNSNVHLLLISSSEKVDEKVDEKVISDTVGKTITIRVKMVYPQFIKTIHLEIFSENNVLEFDTSLVPLSKEYRDSIDIVRLLTSDGQKTIIVKSIIDDGTFRGDTAILFVAKQSAINHKPKLSITGIKPSITIEEACSLRVTVNDTDLNQSHTTTVSYKSKTDTVKNSLYILKSSAAEIDTLVFVTKDNGAPPLSDTQKVIITVITKGTPAAPQWDTDTLDVKLKSGSAYTLNLKDTCHDPNGDTLSFVIIPNPQVTGAISGAAYSFTPSNADTGTRAVRIVAKDPGNLSDTMTIRFTITSALNDTTPPELKRYNPMADSLSFSAAKVAVQIVCKDQSGIAAITCKSGTNDLPVTKTNDTVYTAVVENLVHNQFTALTFTAIDSSKKGNNASLTVTVKYDSSMTDNVGPSITLQTPDKDSSSVSTSTVTVTVKCTDDNGVASVGCFFGGKEAAVTKSSGDVYSATVTGLTQGFNTITFTVTDASTNANTATKSIVVKYDSSMTDNVGPSITLQTPDKDSSSVSASTVPVTVKCTDDNGVASVIGVIGTKEIPFVKSSDNNFTATVSGLALGLNALKITATDASANTNKTTKTYTINYDPTMADNVGPVFTKISGPVSGTVVTDPAVTLVYSITDTNQVDSVYWTLNGTRMADLKAGTGDQYTITCTLPKSHENVIVINAQDVSTKRNKNSITITLDYTKRFTITTSISADVPGVSGTITQNPTGTVIDSNTTVQLTAPADLKYNFTGWTGGVTDTAHTIKVVMNGNKTVAANYTLKNFSVKFNSQGGSAVADQPVAYGGKVSSPTEPGRAGYTFGGWYKETACINAWTFSTDTVTSDITLFAKWTANVYTVTFDGNGATVAPVPTSKSVTVPATTVDNLPTDPQKIGYNFGGWLTSNGAPFTANTVVSENIIVSAKWIEKPKSTVVFDDDGATTSVSPSIVIVTTNSTFGTLPTAPKKTSYTFCGWYSGMNGGGTVITANSKITKDTTVYAWWKILDVDGNEYHEVQIGNQVWMVENLKTTKFKNGTTIPQVTDSATWGALTTPAFCYYNNLSNNKDKYGALYNWYTVSAGNLAPDGWHVPTDAEWDTLQNYCIVSGYNWDNTTTGNKIAKSLAATTDWVTDTTTGTIGNNLAINNRSGFSALPGGFRFPDGYLFPQSFYGQSFAGIWWSATENSASDAWSRGIGIDGEDLGRTSDWPKSCGLSLRLVRD